MRIDTTTVILKTDAFTKYSTNPIQYRDANPHNVMVDLDCLDRAALTVQDLIDFNAGAIGVDLFRDVLPVLERDGYIKLAPSLKSAETEADTDSCGGLEDEDEI